MADTLIKEPENKAEEGIISGTADEIQRRMQSEPGFYKQVEKAMDEGKLKIIDPNAVAPVAEPIPEVKSEVKAEETPKEEKVTVEVHKKDLDKYEGNVGKALKSLEEKERYIKNLEAQISERAVAPKVETKEPEKPATEVKSEVKQEAKKLILEEIKALDDLEGIKDDEFGEKVFTTDNQKRILSTLNKLVKSTPSIVNYNNELEAKIQALEAKLSDATKKQEEVISKTEALAKDQREKMESESVFVSCGELQSNHEELKTKKPLREIDNEYLAFLNRLNILTKSYDEKAKGEVINKFFFDSSEEGNRLRKLAEENGVRPPEEVDKYFALRETLSMSKEKQLPLDEAYVLRQYKNGGINKVISTAKAEENRRIQGAIDERKKFVETMDSTQIAPTSPAEDAEEQQFVKLLTAQTPLIQIKKDEKLRKLYDKFAPNYGTPINWDKVF